MSLYRLSQHPTRTIRLYFHGMDGIKQVLGRLAPGQQIAVFIGPEGGFDEEEIKLALKMGVKPVSLGKRILRTETAGPAILALLMMKLEGAF